MARVTVEDCIEQVPNRFELVLLSAHRAREIAGGAPLHVDRDRDKNPVVALREIAEHRLNLEDLGNSLIKGMQKRVEPDQPEDDLSEIMAQEHKWVAEQASASEAEEAGFSTDVDEDEDEELIPEEGEDLI